MMMIIFNKMNVHVLCTKNENSHLTLNAGNIFEDEEDSFKDSLFFKVQLKNKDFYTIKIFNLIGKEDGIAERYYNYNYNYTNYHFIIN